MIEIKDLHKSFSGKQVLKGVDLTIKEGETLVIIGRSGCGKSVLLKHITALIEPEAGTVLIEGKDMFTISTQEQDEIRLKIGMVFQGAALFDSLDVHDNVGYSLIEHTKMEPQAISEKVREKLRLVGLSGVEEVMPSDLSGGMKKRVSLARAICNEPKIVLYDEPTTGLDPINSDVINDLILRTQERLKVTSIVVTHDMTSAYKVANRIAMLYEGKIIGIGTPDEIRNTQDPVIRQFITGSAKGPITEGKN